MAHIIKCPSGLSFHARKLQGSEANLFTDRKLVRKGLLVGKILGSTFEGLIDPGPYNIPTDGIPPWDQLLTGDRIAALVQLRVATYTRELEFKVQCDNDGCRKRFDIDLDLIDDLQHKMLSEGDRAAFASGNKLTTTISIDEKPIEITFHLMTAKDEVRMASIASRIVDQQVTASLGQRIDSIAGVHPNDKIKWLNDLDLDIMTELVELLDTHDCGIDTDIEAECEHCANFMDIAVPLGGREFFLPKRKKTPKTAAPQLAD